MKKYNPTNVMNGTYGELWIDDDYMGQTTALEAKVTFEKSSIVQAGKLSTGYKIIGYDGKGTVKMNKVSSYFLKKVLPKVKKGKTPVFTIISKLKDPDAFGAERVKLTGVIFDEITLANWEVKKNGEESVPFTFESWELLDTV